MAARRPTVKNPPKIPTRDEIKKLVKPHSVALVISRDRETPVPVEELDAALDVAYERVADEMSDTIWAAATKMVLCVHRRYLKDELIKEVAKSE